MAWFDEFNLPGATIDGYFGFIKADGPDDDDYPDVVLANGTVTFTATTEAARIDGAWLGIQPVTAQIFEGKIVISEEDPRPVRLLATDAPIGVADWAWRASFKVSGFQLNDLTFRAPRDTTVNLTADMIPVKSQPYQIIEGASIVDAEVDDAGRMRFELSDGSLTSWVDVPNGERGIAGPPGERGPQGDPGPAPTLAIGSVSAGAAADAWMTGTQLARELNLTLPRGQKGDRGEQGIPGTYAGKGDSAYQIAVAGGFKGTEEEWLASLRTSTIDQIDGLGEALAALAPVESGDDLIASRLAFRAGDITVGVASDSTSDGATDWPRMWEAHMAQRFPHLRIEHQQWVDANAAYGPTTVVQEGEGEPAFSGTLLHDTFTRTSDLATPDEGGPWTVTNPDAFTLTGSALVATGVGRLRLDTGARDMTTSMTLVVDTTGTGTAQTYYIYHGWTHGSMLQIHINGGGLATAYIYRRVGNVNEMVTSQRLDLALGVPVNGAAGPLTVEFQCAIQNHAVTLGYGGKEWAYSWAITEDAYAAMEAEVSIFPQSATPGMPIDEVTVAVADRPSTYQTLKVLCGTKGGGTLDYQREHWDAMFGWEDGTPGESGGTIQRTITDGFSRTGEVVGTTTATGQTWGGTTGAWVTDGTAATATGAKIGQITIPLPDATEAEFTVEAVTTAAAASQTLRLGIATTGGGVYGFFANLLVNAAGVFGASAYVRTPAGGYRELGAITDHGIAGSSPSPQQVPVKIRRTGRSFTVTIGAGQMTVTITQDEADQLGDRVEIQAATPALPGFRVLDMAATWTETAPPAEPVHGDPLDVMLISHGHNYGSMGTEQYVQVVEDFLAFMREHRPSTVPLFVSQNPQFAPAANPVAHARRQAAIRAFARRHGHGYAPVFEHFAAQPDGGKSWVSPDGVHPTAPATPTITDGRGTSEWGGVLADAVTD